MSINKAILLGNVGADPKIQSTQNSKVAQVSLATTERGYTLPNGTAVPDRTEWHNLIAWGRTAEVIEKYVRKGSKLYVEGKIKTRSYDDRSGQKRYVTEVHIEVMELLDHKPAANSGQQQDSDRINF